jgi:transcriptional regulator with XRE-family HTH domain
MRRAPSEIGKELGTWMLERGLTEKRLSEQINELNHKFIVSQSWISRIINGEFKRFSEKVELVMLYAGIRIENDDSHTPSGEEIIAKAVKAAWDGSLDGAQAVALILRGAADLRRSAKER